MDAQVLERYREIRKQWTDRYRENGVMLSTQTVLRWARADLRLDADLERLHLDEWSFTESYGRWELGTGTTRDLTAPGFRIRFRLVPDQEEYDPGDCHNPYEYDDCRAGRCDCYPEEVWGVVAEVYDAAGIEVSHESLWSIGSDGSAKDRRYVLSEMVVVAEDACHHANVALNLSEED